MTGTPGSEPRNRLRLEVEPLDDEDRTGRSVSVFVDDIDLAETTEHLGRAPHQMLGPASPLPATPDRRPVLLLRCGCGSEGCSSVWVHIRRVGDTVVWDDFHDGSESWLGTPMAGIGPFVFPANTYEDELARAHTARDWETDDERLERIVFEALYAHHAEIADLGYALDAVWTGGEWDEPGLRVSLMHPTEFQSLLLFSRRAGEGTSEYVDRIVSVVLHDDPSTWKLDRSEG